MTDTSVKVNPHQQVGGAMGFLADKLGFELEPQLSSAAKGAGGIFQEVISLGQEIAGAGKFPPSGTIEFREQQNVAKDPELLRQEQQAVNNKIFFRNLEEMRDNTQRFAHERALEDIIRLEIAGEPTEEKNRDLHLSLDLDEKNISYSYHMHALREKKKENWGKLEEKKKNTSIQSPAKRPSALETMFEGGSGTQGSGQGNLSFQATG